MINYWQPQPRSKYRQHARPDNPSELDGLMVVYRRRETQDDANNEEERTCAQRQDEVGASFLNDTAS